MKISQSSPFRGFILGAALFAGFGFNTHASAQERPYLIDLNSNTATELAGETVTAINDAGQVVGNTADHAFITGPDGAGIRVIGGDQWTQATGINNAGKVVGTHSGTAFITGPDGLGMTHLQSPAGLMYGEGINDRGQVIGFFSTADGIVAFITGPGGVA